MKLKYCKPGKSNHVHHHDNQERRRQVRQDKSHSLQELQEESRPVLRKEPSHMLCMLHPYSRGHRGDPLVSHPTTRTG